MRLVYSLTTAMALTVLVSGCAQVQSPPDTKIVPAGYSGPKGVPSQGLNKAAYHAGVGFSMSPSKCMGCHWGSGTSSSGGWPPSGPGGVANGGNSPTHNADGSRKA